MYELNIVNIEMILRNFYGITEELKRERLLTLIFAQGDTSLAKYAESRLEECINTVLQEAEDVVDSEEVVLFILNKEDVAVETKEVYISRQQTPVTDLENVEMKNIWSCILENNKVQASPENIFTYYYESEGVIPFIKKNLSNYVKMITEENYVRSELLDLLDEHVNDKMALTLLEFETAPISIRGKQYSEEVICHILDQNLDEKDMPYLIANYPMKQEKINSGIRRITKENIADIAKKQYQVSTELLDIIISDTSLSDEERGKVLAWNLAKVNRNKAKEYLRQMNLVKYIEMMEGKRPLVEMTEFNEIMLTEFKKKKWVSSFEEDAKKEGMYRGIGVRPR